MLATDQAKTAQEGERGEIRCALDEQVLGDLLQAPQVQFQLPPHVTWGSGGDGQREREREMLRLLLELNP